jgi:hypothetical protein
MLSATWLGILVCLLYVGCQDRPARVPAPSWDPQGISSRAIEQLDTNSDSTIDADEAKKAPGLAAGLARIDMNGDRQMSAEEIGSRIELYKKLGTGLISQSFVVLVNGRPLPGARVDFVPEEFLGGVIKTATGEADSSGLVIPQTIEQNIPAMQVGFYQVKVYLAQDQEPLETTQSVGIEVSPITTENESGTPILRFKRI